MIFGILGFVGGVAIGVICKAQILKLVEAAKGLVAKFSKKKN